MYIYFDVAVMHIFNVAVTPLIPSSLYPKISANQMVSEAPASSQT